MVNICLSLDRSEINRIWGSTCSIVVHTPDDFYVVDDEKAIDYPVDEIKETIENFYNIKSKRVVTDGYYVYVVSNRSINM